MTTLIIDIIGWIGALTLLSAYIILSGGKVIGQSWIYQTLNISGGGALIINSTYHGAIPSAALNIIWCITGLATLVIIFKRKGHSDQGHSDHDSI